MKIHTTVGVYNNGDMVFNGVPNHDLSDHIDYNLHFRPGRAFFVDGKCFNVGYLGEKRCQKIAREIKNIKLAKLSLGYV